MISRKTTSRGAHVAGLDEMLRIALRDESRRTRPPTRVWENIQRAVQRRRGAGRYAWLDEMRLKLEDVVRRQIVNSSRKYAGSPILYRCPMAFGGRERYVSFSLVCIIEQQMPILRLGWTS